MKMIDRYIGKAIILSTLMVCTVMLGLLFFIALINEINDAGGFLAVLYFSILQIPVEFYELFPIALFLGVLIGLGRLNTLSELIVMRSVGISVRRIMWSVLKAGFLMIFVATIIGEYVAPKWQFLYDAYENKKAFSFSTKHAIALPHSIWIREGESFTHISTFENMHEIQGVTRYFFDDHDRMQKVLYANTGVWENKHWELEKPEESAFEKSVVDTPVILSDRLNVGIRSRREESLDLASQDQTLGKLYKTIGYRTQFGLNPSTGLYAFWKRILQPITCFIMIILAVPFVFGSFRDSSASFRILVGVMLGVMFYTLSQLFGPITIVYQFPPFLAAVMPTLMFALVAVFFLLRG